MITANVSPRLKLHHPEIRRPVHPDESQTRDARIPRQSMKQYGLDRVALLELVLLKNVRGQKANFRAQSRTANNVVDLSDGEQVDRADRIGIYD